MPLVILMKLIFFRLKLFIPTAAILEKLELLAEAVVASFCYDNFITFTISHLFWHFDKYFASSKKTFT